MCVCMYKYIYIHIKIYLQLDRCSMTCQRPSCRVHQGVRLNKRVTTVVKARRSMWSICQGNYGIPADPSSFCGKWISRFSRWQLHVTPLIHPPTLIWGERAEQLAETWVTCHGFHMFSCDPPKKKRKTFSIRIAAGNHPSTSFRCSNNLVHGPFWPPNSTVRRFHWTVVFKGPLILYHPYVNEQQSVIQLFVAHAFSINQRHQGC